MSRELIYGSDLIVELLKKSDVRYFSCTPGATFRGIHDSIVQVEDTPQLLTLLFGCETATAAFLIFLEVAMFLF